MMGLLRSSSRIDVVLGNEPQAFEDVSRIFKDQGAVIISVGCPAIRIGKNGSIIFAVRNAPWMPSPSLWRRKDIGWCP